MDVDNAINVVSVAVAVVAVLVALMQRRDAVLSERRRAEAEREAARTRDRTEANAAALRKSAAESLASLAQAYVEVSGRTKRADAISIVSQAKQIRLEFAREIVMWIDLVDSDYVESTTFDLVKPLHQFSRRSRQEFSGDGAFMMMTWVGALFIQLSMAIGGRPTNQSRVSEVCVQARSLVGAWVEDPDLYDHVEISRGVIGW